MGQVQGVVNEEAQRLLTRGKFALEDLEFQKAMGFFERALDVDPMCAEAYVGEFLALQKLSSLEEYLRDRLAQTAHAQGELLPLQPNITHIEKMAELNAVEPDFTRQDIRRMYDEPFSYTSCVAARQAQRRQEEQLWEESALLNRAEKLAAGAFGQKLAQAKQDFFARLDERIMQAQMDSVAAADIKLVEYEQFVRKTDKLVVVKSEQIQIHRENLYQHYSQAVDGNDIRELTQAAMGLDALGEYKDSKELAEQCRQMIAQLKKEQAVRHKKSLAKLAVVAAAAVGLAVVTFIIVRLAILSVQYRNAQKLMEQGDYQAAIRVFAELADYKDSEARVAECETLKRLEDRYNEAQTLLAAGNRTEAIAIFNELGDYKDSAQWINEAACCTKELPLSLSLKAGGGAAPEDAQVRFFIPGVPDEEITSITVSGSKAVLEQETVLNLATVDLSAVRDGTRLSFVLDELPLLKAEDISNESGVNHIYAVITFEELKEREFTDMFIMAEGVPNGLQANLSVRRANVVVRGPSELVDRLTREDFCLVVDLTTAVEGKEYYPVKVVFDSNFEALGALVIDHLLVDVKSS